MSFNPNASFTYGTVPPLTPNYQPIQQSPTTYTGFNPNVGYNPVKYDSPVRMDGFMGYMAPQYLGHAPVPVFSLKAIMLGRDDGHVYKDVPTYHTPVPQAQPMQSPQMGMPSMMQSPQMGMPSMMQSPQMGMPSMMQSPQMGMPSLMQTMMSQFSSPYKFRWP